MAWTFRDYFANEHLVGKMVAVTISHDLAPFYKNTIYYEDALIRDNIQKTLLDYLAGKSTRIPSRVEYKYATYFTSPIFVPENQYLTESFASPFFFSLIFYV